MDINNYICESCESEFVIEEIYSEKEIALCPYCGTALNKKTDRDE